MKQIINQSQTNQIEEYFPKVEDYKIEEKWNTIAAVRKEVNKALELARAEKVIGHPLDAEVLISVSEDMAKDLVVDEGLERIFLDLDQIGNRLNFLDSRKGLSLYPAKFFRSQISRHQYTPFLKKCKIHLAFRQVQVYNTYSFEVVFLRCRLGFSSRNPDLRA